MEREQLLKMKVSELLAIAKDYSVPGRHNMRKDQLVAAIVENQPENLEEKSEGHGRDRKPAVSGAVPCMNVGNKIDYVEHAKIGTLVAFKVNETKVLSGMIEEIHKAAFVVNTKAGIRFTVIKNNVIWVKTGKRWPKGVYLALKGEVM